MDDKVTLWARWGAIEAHWQLGAVGQGQRRALLGWDTDTDQVDAGVPDPVVGAWSRALAACARVSFLCAGSAALASGEWVLDGEDKVRATPKARGIGWIVSRLPGKPLRPALRCTRRAARCKAMWSIDSSPRSRPRPVHPGWRGRCAAGSRHCTSLSSCCAASTRRRARCLRGVCAPGNCSRAPERRSRQHPPHRRPARSRPARSRCRSPPPQRPLVLRERGCRPAARAVGWPGAAPAPRTRFDRPV